MWETVVGGIALSLVGMSEDVKRRSLTRRLAGGIAIIVCLGLALSYPRWLNWTERAPTEREEVLYFFAENLGAPALCEQFRGAPFSGTVSCLRAVALRSGVPIVTKL